MVTFLCKKFMGPYCHYKFLKNLPYCVVMPKRLATPQFQTSQSAGLKWIINNNNKLNKTHNWLDSTNIRTIHDSNHFALDPDHLRNPLWYENKNNKNLNSEKVFKICFCFRTKNATETKKTPLLIWPTGVLSVPYDAFSLSLATCMSYAFQLCFLVFIILPHCFPCFLLWLFCYQIFMGSRPVFKRC